MNNKIDQFFKDNPQLPPELLDEVKQYYNCESDEALEILDSEFHAHNKDDSCVLATMYLEDSEIPAIIFDVVNNEKLQEELEPDFTQILCKDVTYYFFLG